MYYAQMTKDRIKHLCKIKCINAKKMLLDCSLGANAIQQINDTKGMASFSLAKIADYLDCSVDYLLGRTDVPEVNRRAKVISIAEQFENANTAQAAAYGENTQTIEDEN